MNVSDRDELGWAVSPEPKHSELERTCDGDAPESVKCKMLAHAQKGNCRWRSFSLMHAWPSHHRPPNTTARASRKKKKAAVRNHPVLDHGVVGAATLVERDGRLEWDTLVSARPAGRFRLISCERPILTLIKQVDIAWSSP